VSTLYGREGGGNAMEWRSAERLLCSAVRAARACNMSMYLLRRVRLVREEGRDVSS
jgi:hypothetical protein